MSSNKEKKNYKNKHWQSQATFHYLKIKEHEKLQNISRQSKEIAEKSNQTFPPTLNLVYIQNPISKHITPGSTNKNSR